VTRSARAEARARAQAEATLKRRERFALKVLGGLAVLLCGSMLLAVGCRGGSGSIAVPSFSPATIAAAALAEFDANKDGALDAKELEHCPSLQDAVKLGLDKDKDGRVTADELEHRLRIYQQEGLMSICGAQVTLDGSPLTGATVTLTPEKFMGPSHKPATGTTGSDGFVTLKAEDPGQGFVAYGFYRIEVSKKGAGGKEMIPAKYNTQTTLGKEFAPARAQDRRGSYDEPLQLKLSSK
jgi:hypothetical protein